MSGAITLKLTALIIRTVSKPIANAIKAQTKQSEFFKTNFVRFGQFVNRVDLALKNNSKVKVRPLNDNRAIEIGSNFLSELFTLSIAGSLIIYESTRPKKDKVGDELKELRAELVNVRSDVDKLMTVLGREETPTPAPAPATPTAPAAATTTAPPTAPAAPTAAATPTAA